MAEYTTQQYINSLKKDRKVLVDNLVSKGIEANESETFTTLAPKVANIGDVSIDDCSYFFSNGARVNEFLNNPSLFSTLKLKNTFSMFDSYNILKENVLDNILLNMSFYNEANISNMFRGYTGANIYNLSETTLNTVPDWSHLFDGINARSVDLSNIDTSNVINMSYMFNGTYNINWNGFQNLNMSNVVNTSYMFNTSSHNFGNFILLNYDMQNVVNASRMFNYMRIWNAPLVQIDNFELTNAENVIAMFDNMSFYNTTNLDLSGVKFYKEINAYSMFGGLNSNSLQSVTLPNFVNGINYAHDMFFKWNCANLAEIKNFQIDFSKVNSMVMTFSSMRLPNITNFNLSWVNTSNVSNFWYCFGNSAIDKIDSLGVENWNVSNATNLSQMFSSLRCPNITSLNLTNWIINDTSGITSLSGMFSYSNYLVDINISNISVSDVVMSNFARNCTNLQRCDIRGINFYSSSALDNAFTGVPNNCTIIVGNTNVKNVIQQTYPNLTNIVTVDEI